MVRTRIEMVHVLIRYTPIPEHFESELSCVIKIKINVSINYTHAQC